MYSMVLMVALTGGAEVPDCHRCGCHGGYGGCYGGCWGGCYGGGYGGCHGGGYGGCWGGCYGGGYGGCYGGGCYGMSYGGCYGMGYGGGCGGVIYGGAMYGGAPTGTVAPATTDGGTKKDGKIKESDRDESNLGRSTSATLIVTLPADAKLSVDGHLTTTTAAVRRFTTPPLDAGRDYVYNLKAEVMNEGKKEVITKRVTVRSGQVTETTLELPISTARAR
jgi:uncharacterized protein (TIGR03000 family)